ncbi:MULTISPECIES: ABC transporter ATP-binding protein [Actinomycetes]|uniref:ABC transporter ATP-binding protein n=2 Tax=Actinomycetes TaxID=1760 RepID=A0ABP6LP45_9MICC|nr:MULTISPECIES: ABC transporter ATP-binding protein [unclassified Nesterenkonia]MDS2172001.1 ABC transporter ATP-binding protein [Nesterenkonia sp. CL21]
MPQHPLCLSLRQVRYAVGSARSATGVQEILRGVDFTARRGEVTVLLGPNGAGKTTALGCAQGLLRPSQGTVSLLGEDPWRAGAGLRARVGVMLQDGGLPQSVRPKVLLEHVARLHADPWPLQDLVDRLDMSGFMGTTVRRLSGGQRQRVALAASLIGRPEAVFLDEPSAGLDPQSRQTVFELVTHLRDRGLGIVLTTHLLEEAQRLADSVHILKDGVVVRHGTVAELTDDGRSRRLIFVSPRTLTRAELEAAPTPMSLDGGADNEPGARWAAGGISGPQDLHRLTDWWRQIDLMPGEVSFEARTLEDVFWEVSVS